MESPSIVDDGDTDRCKTDEPTEIPTIQLQNLSDSTPLLESGMMRLQALDRGYVYLPRFLPPNRIHDLRKVVLAACRDVGWIPHDGEEIGDSLARPISGSEPVGDYRSPVFGRFQSAVQSSLEFEELGRDEGLRSVLESILQTGVRNQCGDVCRVVPPLRSTPTVPHQDAHYIHSSTSWTAWIPLAECPRLMGPLAVLDSSHLDGLLPHDHRTDDQEGISDLENKTWSTTDFRCGDLLLFGSLTVHRALPNRSQQTRLSVDYRFEPAV